MTWLAPRALFLRAGRPYVLKRNGRWYVLTGERGLVAVACCLPHAHQTAREWSVFHHGWTGVVS